MNIGQVLEVNLGYAAKACGIKVMTPVFDSARENDIGDTFDTARELWHGENAPAYPTKPVSYTHLDVYKRQVPVSAR